MGVRELRVSYVSRDVPADDLVGCQMKAPQDAAQVLVHLLVTEAVEVFGLLCLSTKQHILCYHELGRGTLDTVTVHPREVLKVALLANAAAVVVAHNHPSGDPTPSGADRDLTRQLVAAGTLIGIPVLDHIIVGHGRYHSCQAAGQL